MKQMRSGLFIIFLMSILLTVVSPEMSLASLSCVDALAQSKSIGYSNSNMSPTTVVATFVRLVKANQLVGQQDSRFADRGWLVENGGLCATTCGINTLITLAEHTGVELGRSHEELAEEFISYSHTNFRKDIRLGVDQLTLAALIEAIAEGHGLEINTKRIDLHNFESLKSAPNQIKIASIKTGAFGGEGHAIVILGLNDRNELIYADPNEPTKIFTSPIIVENHWLVMTDSSVFGRAYLHTAVVLSVPN